MKKTLAAVLLAVSVAACGGGNDKAADDTPASPSETSAADLPVCSEVWVDGRTLPTGYDGCVGADGKAVEGNVKQCGAGPKEYARYEYTDADDITFPFVAILGEMVVEYTDDENGPYAKLLKKCETG